VAGGGVLSACRPLNRIGHTVVLPLGAVAVVRDGWKSFSHFKEFAKYGFLIGVRQGFSQPALFC
jgi:hypothetical protein